jgi:tripartite-type tricarboxylate transporter receptor subunit TctC
VAQVLVESVVLAVRQDAKWKTLGDFVADARSRPKAISIGHSGIGSHTHISLAALAFAAGFEANEVPFGAAQVVPSLLGGHVDAVVQLPAALAAPVKQGQVRLLAALIPQRDPALPDVPTAREQGFDVSLEAWRGVAVPAGTPRAVIALLEDSIRRTAQSPEFVRGAENLGVRPAFLPAAEFGERVAKEDASLSRLMQRIGLKKSPAQ